MQRSGLLVDIDGVVVVSWEPVPGAVGALAAIRAAGVPIRFVTNTTSRSSEEIAGLLRGIGVEVADGDLVTAGSATAAVIEHRYEGASCYVLNDGSMDDLADLRIVGADEGTDADVVVIGSGGPVFGWHEMNVALRALQGGAALVAMHGAFQWTTSEGACLDTGAYAQMLAGASGVEPLVVGKPAAELFTTACASMGVEPGDATMVGDDVLSDVLAAQALGIEGVLVRTGKYRPEAVEAADGTADHVIDSLADLPALLGL